MLKSLILFTLMLNIAFAKDRFSDADKKRFLEDVKKSIAEHKTENRGRVDLQIIKPGLYAELEESLKQEKFTRDEMNKIKQDYEKFSSDRSIKPDKAEQEFYAFMNNELDGISKKPLEKTKEGYICNNWGCEDGLKCAPDPLQASDKGKKAGLECRENAECASQECAFEKVGSKKKVCEDVMRCFRPLRVGESCMANPVCGAGSCLPFSLKTSGIGECTDVGVACKSNSECCSKSCDGAFCKSNFICKDCVNKGSKPSRGQKCCEGLYPNDKGVCSPDVPPSVIEEVQVSPKKSSLVSFVNFLVSSADAGEVLSGAAALEDEQTFLNLGVSNDGQDLKSGIMNNQNKYKNFAAISKEGVALDVDQVKPTLMFNKKSDFTTCDINFKDDFYNSLKASGAFELEIAMLGFDFVSTGDADSDYWKGGSVSQFPEIKAAGTEDIVAKLSAEAARIPHGDPSIYNRLKAIGLAHRAKRAATNVQIDNINKKLTCSCLDVIGYEKITNAEKKKFFETSCAEYAQYKDPTVTFEKLSQDASGLKSKRLLVTWTQSLTSFMSTLAIDNNASYTQLLSVSKFVASDAKWNTAEARNYDLFKFSIKNPSGSVAALGAIVGALLAAGVIAILGGFATTSILSAWAAAGIIAASAATGAGGLWMIATLKGAWITMRPVISDYEVAPRTYSCGKKESCTEYTRTLVQPYNQICNAHTSANACIKSFVIINDAHIAGYIVDPWIPYGVSKASILRNQPNYVEKLEAGFQSAKNAMVVKNPGATGGGGKKGEGEFVSESYLSEVFIDGNVLGQYAPAIGQNMQENYFLGQDKIKIIKDAAKSFAVSEGFLLEGDTENLNKFADYAYEYHFVWPKKSRPEEVSYPTMGLTTYLDYMSIKVSGNLSAGLANSAKKLSRLQEKYQKDYNNTLSLYDTSLNQVDGLKKQLVSAEIEKSTKALSSLANFNSLLDSGDLDSKLRSLSAGGANASSSFSGAGVGAGGITGDQSNFLKAVSNLRSTRKDQVKALDNYTKAMALSGDKERTSKMAAVSKKFSNSFSKGNSSYGGMNSAGASAVGASISKDATDGSDKHNYYGNPNGNLNGSGNSGSVGSLYGLGSGSSSNSSKSSSDNRNGSGSYGGSNADAKKLSDAIDARNKNNSMYKSNEEQTLFEKVTNAYIRNYDKVLSKKKDKDVIEEKQ